MEEYVTEETCRGEMESVAAHGQLSPVIARRVASNADFDFEIVSGARRLFVARHLNSPLRVDVRSLSDKECIAVYDVENRLRKDVSPYERGRSFVSWLAAGHFSSQDDLAAYLKISASQVSRLIKLAKLPAVIVSAFEHPTDICENWGLRIFKLWQDPLQRDRLIARARRLSSLKDKGTALSVLEKLTSNIPNTAKPRFRDRDEVVTCKKGKALFRIKHHRNEIVFVFRKDLITDAALRAITESALLALQDPPGVAPSDGRAHGMSDANGPAERATPAVFANA